MDEENEKAYRWEGDYEKTWEALKEDATGSLQASIELEIEKAKKQRLAKRPCRTRLGMMRHIFIVVDTSLAMTDIDLKPNRIVVTLKLLEKFVSDFFDQNPIGQIGFITTCGKRAELASDMSGTPRKHLDVLKNMLTEIIQTEAKSCVGEPSLQNSITLAMKTLKHMPNHTSREVLILMGSLTTCDPNPIEDTIQEMKSEKIRCSVIALSAEVYICRKLVKATNGVFNVILDETHFMDVLHDHISPPSGMQTESSMMKMGFPYLVPSDTSGKISYCMSTKQFNIGGYYCPNCRAKYSDLPVQCKICALTLVSAPHLARSYHHLFPLPLFVESRCKDLSESSQQQCYSCLKNFDKSLSCHVCERCNVSFCLDCNLFIHETLNCCPGCINNRCELSMLNN